MKKIITYDYNNFVCKPSNMQRLTLRVKNEKKKKKE